MFFTVDRVVEAFKQMTQHSIEGVAVVNSSGKLVDSISVTDLKLISPNSNNFRFLWEVPAQFKKNHLSRCPELKKNQMVVCTSTDTLVSVAHRMVIDRVHRVFVVNNKTEMFPIDVIT